MDDTKKKLLVACAGALVLGAGSYFAFSGSPRPERIQKQVVATKKQRPKPPEVEKERRKRPKTREKSVVNTDKRRPVREKLERGKKHRSKNRKELKNKKA